MRRSSFAPTLILAVLAAATLAAAPAPVLAQGQQKPQILPLKPPPPPPIKPYTPVAAKPPVPYDDAAFVAFRKQLADVAAKKDRAALAKLVVAQGFFWIQDKDIADPKKPGIDNLAKAIDLAAKDGSGWATLGGYGNEPTAAELPDHKGVFCAPADPTIDPQAFEALGEATQTDPSEWGYPLKDGVEVHAARAAEFSGRRKARAQPGARAARYRGAERSEPAGLPACGDAVRQIRLRRHGCHRAARRRPDVLHQGCQRLENYRLSRRREPVDGFMRRNAHDGTIILLATTPMSLEPRSRIRVLKRRGVGNRVRS